MTDATKRLPPRAVAGLVGAVLLILVLAIGIPCGVRGCHRSRIELCRTNLHTIEDAVLDVLSASNYQSSASVTLPEVEQRLSAGSIEKMDWPKGAVPPTVDQLKRFSEQSLYVTYDGEKIITGR